jgi:uncharacterized membrane protein
MSWQGIRIRRRIRQAAIVCVVAFLIGGCACQIAVFIDRSRAWDREVAPFKVLGVKVNTREGGAGGPWDDRESVRRILFENNVGDAEIAALAGRMERFPNLHILVLEGPKVTDAGLEHLKGLKQLRTIILRGTRVTEEGRAELRRALPNLRGL